MRTGKLLVLACIALSFYACDKIEPPYKEEVITPDFCATGIDDSIPNKKVLVEDYTGHICGNCPDANIYLNDTLKAIYNHCLVVISVHAGFWAGTCPSAIACPHATPPLPSDAFTTDFNTVPGNDWYSFFDISANPMGMIDRIEVPNSTNAKVYTEWAGAIASRLTLDAEAKIEITNSYNSSTNSVDVAVETEFVQNVSGEYKLQVVITEDSIVDWQQWYNHTPQYNDNYVHHHILRDVINTTYGETLFSNGTNAGNTINKNYSYTLNNAWNVNQCSIVAFLYRADTYEVMQVEEKKVN